MKVSHSLKLSCRYKPTCTLRILFYQYGDMDRFKSFSQKWEHHLENKAANKLRNNKDLPLNLLLDSKLDQCCSRMTKVIWLASMHNKVFKDTDLVTHSNGAIHSINNNIYSLDKINKLIFLSFVPPLLHKSMSLICKNNIEVKFPLVENLISSIIILSYVDNTTSSFLKF